MNVLRRVLATIAAAVLAVAAAGCSSKTSTDGTALAPVRIGVVASEDCLPLWVAERDGLFKDAGLDVRIVGYGSAQERDAACKGGTVDAVASDLVAAARLRGSGTGVRVVTVMLGATPAEGRYGIAVKPGSTVTSLVDLAGKPVGTSTGTLEEYVLESLMYEAGLGPKDIKEHAVKTASARLESLLGGQLEAALLPEPYLSLAEKRGVKVVAQDTRDANLSQTVLVASGHFLDTEGGSAATAKLLEVWSKAAQAINKDPASYRPLLAKKVEALAPVASSYRMSRYPSAQLPTLDDAEAVFDWMYGNGLVPESVTYDALMWKPPVR